LAKVDYRMIFLGLFEDLNIGFIFVMIYTALITRQNPI
jgi:hypothetical protein